MIFAVPSPRSSLHTHAMPPSLCGMSTSSSFWLGFQNPKYSEKLSLYIPSLRIVYVSPLSFRYFSVSR